MKKITLACILMLVSSANHAAMVWVPSLTTAWGSQAGNTNFLIIESYRMYWDGANAVLMVRFKPEGWVNTGCAVSDANKIMSYWAPDNANAFHQVMLTSIVEAMAQQKRVRVEYDNAICGGEGGRKLFGIETEPLGNN